MFTCTLSGYSSPERDKQDRIAVVRILTLTLAPTSHTAAPSLSLPT